MTTPRPRRSEKPSKTAAKATASPPPRKLPKPRGRPVAIATELISVSKYAVRHPPFQDADFAELLASMKSTGKNLVPAAARPLVDGKFELIYGHRRLAAAQALNLRLECLIYDLTDDDLPYFIVVENEGRAKPRPYALGLMFRRWLNEKKFPSQVSLAASIGYGKSDVCSMTRLADLPSVIVEAFNSPNDLITRHAARLHQVWEKEPELVKQRVAAVHALREAKSVPSAARIYQTLIGQAPKQTTEVESEPVRPSNWLPLVTQNGNVGHAELVDRKVTLQFNQALTRYQAEALATCICSAFDSDPVLTGFGSGR